MTSAIGSWSNWTLSRPTWSWGFARPRVDLAKHFHVLRSSTCKYCLFCQHLINVSSGLLMCKWVKALLPLCRHNVCTKAQSCLRRRDSQISRCGAKPVALSTREPLRVFNSLSSPLPHLLLFLYVWMKPLCVYMWVCVCACVCVCMCAYYLSKSLHVCLFLPYPSKFSQCLSSQRMAAQVKLGWKVWETSRYWYRAQRSFSHRGIQIGKSKDKGSQGSSCSHMNANRIKVPALEADIQFTYWSLAAARPHPLLLKTSVRLWRCFLVPATSTLSLPVLKRGSLQLVARKAPPIRCFIFQVFFSLY